MADFDSMCMYVCVLSEHKPNLKLSLIAVGLDILTDMAVLQKRN